jgi:RNA polymerase sigma factor (sigma-70 family)
MNIQKIEHEIKKNNFKYWTTEDFQNETLIESPMPDFDEFEKKKLNIQKDINKVAPELRQFYSEPLLTKKQEFHSFRRMNYYKYKVKFYFDAYESSKLDIWESKCIEFFNKYQTVRNFIVSCNTRLAAQILKKRKDFYGDNINDLISDCFFNIIKAADGFDYTRGFAFSTYCTWVLMNNSLRDHMHNKKFFENISTNIDNGTFSERIDEKETGGTSYIEEQESISTDISKVLSIIKARDPREHFIIVNCFGIGSGKKKTLKEISEDLKLTKERVRQIRENGINFLKQQIAEGNLSLSNMF